METVPLCAVIMSRTASPPELFVAVFAVALSPMFAVFASSFAAVINLEPALLCLLRVWIYQSGEYRCGVL